MAEGICPPRFRRNRSSNYRWIFKHWIQVRIQIRSSLYGSGGASTSQSGFSLADSIMSIKFIDGQGNWHIAKKGDDLFAAVGVSLGLFGIITEVEFQCLPSFNVVGKIKVSFEVL